MIALPLRQPLNGEEYLAYECTAPFKSEFVKGELCVVADDLVWQRSPIFLENPTDVLVLSPIGCEVPLSEIYKRIEFPALP